jgi:hypothetical protein
MSSRASKIQKEVQAIHQLLTASLDPDIHRDLQIEALKHKLHKKQRPSLHFVYHDILQCLETLTNTTEVHINLTEKMSKMTLANKLVEWVSI